MRLSLLGFSYLTLTNASYVDENTLTITDQNARPILKRTILLTEESPYKPLKRYHITDEEEDGTGEIEGHGFSFLLSSNTYSHEADEIRHPRRVRARSQDMSDLESVLLNHSNTETEVSRTELAEEAFAFRRRVHARKPLRVASIPDDSNEAFQREFGRLISDVGRETEEETGHLSKDESTAVRPLVSFFIPSEIRRLDSVIAEDVYVRPDNIASRSGESHRNEEAILCTQPEPDRHRPLDCEDLSSFYRAWGMLKIEENK